MRKYGILCLSLITAIIFVLAMLAIISALNGRAQYDIVKERNNATDEEMEQAIVAQLSLVRELRDATYFQKKNLPDDEITAQLMDEVLKDDPTMSRDERSRLWAEMLTLLNTEGQGALLNELRTSLAKSYKKVKILPATHSNSMLIDSCEELAESDHLLQELMAE